MKPLKRAGMLQFLSLFDKFNAYLSNVMIRMLESMLANTIEPNI